MIKKLWRWIICQFCPHEPKMSEVVSWNWVHYAMNNEPWSTIEATCRCKRCGRLEIIDIYQPEETFAFADEHRETRREDRVRWMPPNGQ